MTDNELIAEFMGGVYFDIGMDNRGYKNLPIPSNRIIISETCSKYIDELEYHKSWDWLMPVVHKIAEYRLAYPEQANKVCEAKVVIGKQYLYEKVVEFIKWHNGNR